jgi:hypothetical protein
VCRDLTFIKNNFPHQPQNLLAFLFYLCFSKRQKKKKKKKKKNKKIGRPHHWFSSREIQQRKFKLYML